MHTAIMGGYILPSTVFMRTIWCHHSRLRIPPIAEIVCFINKENTPNNSKILLKSNCRGSTVYIDKKMHKIVLVKWIRQLTCFNQSSLVFIFLENSFTSARYGKIKVNNVTNNHPCSQLQKQNLDTNWHQCYEESRTTTRRWWHCKGNLESWKETIRITSSNFKTTDQCKSATASAPLIQHLLLKQLQWKCSHPVWFRSRVSSIKFFEWLGHPGSNQLKLWFSDITHKPMATDNIRGMGS